MKKCFLEEIRTVRRQRHESQSRVAQRLGVSQQVVSQVERGKGSIEQLAKLCRGLGIPLELRIGRQARTLVHPLDPDERQEIEANIAWFSRLEPADRLQAIREHVRAVAVLRKAAAVPRQGHRHRSEEGLKDGR